ncbi:hypothetical protein BDN72DRAFT_901770 [Pluteus cervinus]|uniref:Uncharacterized protein n=1 Tax=Pluteus cervinus TaxID=181527 RepID=A0ACD3AH75_9AGAR|nr:hypothetical protein BDN72DRAFT_901770 [Pluteus cervinus]
MASRLRKEEMEMEKSGRRPKRDILADDGARQTLLVLCIEHTLKRIIDVAEDALRERKKKRAHQRRMAHMQMGDITDCDADAGPRESRAPGNY